MIIFMMIMFGIFHSFNYISDTKFVKNGVRYLLWLSGYKNIRTITIAPNFDYINKVEFQINKKIHNDQKVIGAYFKDMSVEKIKEDLESQTKEYLKTHCKFCDAQIEEEFLFCPLCDKQIKEIK